MLEESGVFFTVSGTLNEASQKYYATEDFLFTPFFLDDHPEQKEFVFSRIKKFDSRDAAEEYAKTYASGPRGNGVRPENIIVEPASQEFRELAKKQSQLGRSVASTFSR